jgi:carbohydrate-selective porin OprB
MGASHHNRYRAPALLAFAVGVSFLGAFCTIAFGQALPDDQLTSLDTGFAPGEVPPANVPYQPTSQPSTAAPSTEPATIAPGDWYGRWQAWKDQVKNKYGTSFDLYVNPADQFVVTGPGSGNNRGVWWYNFHLEQKLWEGARVVSNTRGGEGKSVNRYVDSLFNFDQHAGEASDIYISHLFFEQKLFTDRLTIDVGKVDLLDWFDDNEVNGWNIFPYSLARNPSIPAPYHAIGGRARVDVSDAVYVEGGVADAGGDVLETGLNTAFRSDEPMFSIVEVGIKPKLMNRPGTYRFIGWYNDGDIARFDGGVAANDCGFDLSFDQQVSDHLGLSFRYGYSNPSMRRINHYWSLGFSYTELIPGRKQDVLGASFANVIQSDAFRDATGADATETQFDVYYKIQIRPWFTVVPDLQVVLNPDQDPDEDVAVIASLFAELRF